MEKKFRVSGNNLFFFFWLLVGIVYLPLRGIASGEPPETSSQQTVVDQSADNVLNKAEQTELLKIARFAAETYVSSEKKPSVSPASSALNQKLGAFVTLKEHSALRGCIGRFEPNIPLYQVVAEMAVAAATQDPRFKPVTAEELPKLEYEISVLSPLRKIQNASEIMVGTHGVRIQKGFRGGVFLPQVATENNWNRETFLSVLCTQKAGLPPDCWKDPNTQLSVFTAQVFSEKE